jgi:hypothetical protein
MLRQAHRRAEQRENKRQGMSARKAVTLNDEPLAMAVEYRDASGALEQVTTRTDLAQLSAARELFVTLSPLSHGGWGDAVVTGDDEMDDSFDLVDLSLAGCCGVQSTYGGLIVSSSYVSATQSSREQRSPRARAAL